MTGFYESSPICDRITLIRSLTGELLYLVEGENQAALIDTGVGAGNLKELVGQLTDKPLIVLLTHGHVDHAPGAVDFDRVYLNEKDLPLYRRFSPLEERKGYLMANMGPDYCLKDEDYAPSQPERI